MTDKKPIAERLRKWAKEIEEPNSLCYADISISTRDIRRIADEIEREEEEIRNVNQAAAVRAAFVEGARRLGKPVEEDERMEEWIRRWYLPRPLFDDGTPVQDYDMPEIGALATCCVYTDGSWRFNPDKYEYEGKPKPWNAQTGREGERIERPMIVRDADGEEIRVGDVVWSKFDGLRLEVAGINGRNYFSVAVIEPDGTGNEYKASSLTHREPDSLEKWASDVNDALDHPEIDWDIAAELKKRYAALMERGE